MMCWCRIVMAPMTRCRALDTLATPAMGVYYRQRASAGGLLVSEGVCVSPNAHGFVDTAGIYTSEQVESWKPVTQAVHKEGAIFFLQLWHVGRASHTKLQPGNADPVSSTTQQVPLPWGTFPRDAITGKKRKHQHSPPRALHTNEIPQVIEWFKVGARNAVDAGFDGCEIHGGHGYLIDQFIKDNTNDRTDYYGGSMPNRCRLLLEITQGVATEIGAQRTAIRISPFTVQNHAIDSNPEELLVYLLQELDKLNLAYIHVTEPEFTRLMDVETWTPQHLHVTRRRTTPLLVSGGHSKDTGNRAVECGYADLVGYGRAFISNPDLVKRFASGAALNGAAKTSSFYDSDQTVGYTDFPFLDDIQSEEEVVQHRARL
ncbi:hypothetical protein M758_9G088200 [Ceratodon purpureus]|nr:hypothetical protein M758_9G088200 [Ceratodon purpureus]